MISSKTSKTVSQSLMYRLHLRSRGVFVSTASLRHASSLRSTRLPMDRISLSSNEHWQNFQAQEKNEKLQLDLKALEKIWMKQLSGLSAKSERDPEKDNREEHDGDNKEQEQEQEQDNNEIKKNENENDQNLDAENSGIKSSTAVSTGNGSQAPPSNNNDGGDGGNRSKSKKHTPPEVYPQMLALPISRRPLFPGFYKAVVISDDRVMKAIREMLDRQQPYIGAFMLKNSDSDSDVIHNTDEVYDIGVFAQITSAFPSKDEKTGTETMTALLYPHRRIKIDALIPPKDKRSHNIDTAQDVKEKPSDISKENERGGSEEALETKEENSSAGTQALATIDGEDLNPTEFLKNYDVSLVNVSNLEDEPFERKSPVINALTSEILKVFKEISQLNSMFREQIATFSASIQSATTNIFEEPARLADFAAAVSAGEEEELQEILESLNIEQRLEKSLLVLKKELMNAELQNKISKDVETKIQKRQREYYLMEQLKGIKRELGIDDGRSKMIETFKKRVEKLQLPESVRNVFDEEVQKLSTLETSMSEFGVIRNYLDWITSLPWGITSKEQYSISSAKTTLDEDHYGMNDVKDRILEFIAVGKLLGKVDGKILCFVGPPGVGKTSIGKSIARSLNRKFFSFSVGGLTDVAEIKGHRRTYIGALPGRVIQALKKCQTQNPLILIDEIDKIGHAGIHGDPSAALLEVLDPEQNSNFLDNYLDISIDLSRVLFVCTANTLDTIPRPLLDRMEVIELTGYVAEDKVKIAERYLAPSAKKAAGLENANVELTESAIRSLMKQYCRESGVRNLKKHIEKIYRKAALNIVKQLSIDDKPATGEDLKEDGSNKSHVSTSQDATTNTNDIEIEKTKDSTESMKVSDDIKINVDSSNLKDYVGPPVYTSDRLYDKTPPGVVMGLAWTSLGGCSLYVESVLEQPLQDCHHPSLERTGQLGDVMKESSRLAYSFSKMYLSTKFPENRFFEKASIHLHCPEGATPKDGPSAGVTMATSLLSLALKRSIDPTIAMTGELTLTGKVLRIGGLREKAVAAKRSGATTIIFPKDNLSDWEELPENVKEGLEPLAADWYEDVFQRVFSGLTVGEASNTWKHEFKLIDAKREKEKEH
ncbi:PIM1 (YBL022C) [Zygosaccharomyces parabailii]|nr:PIM1 (YBL022C) [Zygosaccharomyces parabailii]